MVDGPKIMDDVSGWQGVTFLVQGWAGCFIEGGISPLNDIIITTGSTLVRCKGEGIGTSFRTAATGDVRLEV